MRHSILAKLLRLENLVDLDEIEDVRLFTLNQFLDFFIDFQIYSFPIMRQNYPIQIHPIR